MGNSNSGRGGLPPQLAQRLTRLLLSGRAASEAAREVGVDRKTAVRYQKRLSEQRRIPRCRCGALIVEARRRRLVAVAARRPSVAVERPVVPRRPGPPRRCRACRTRSLARVSARLGVRYEPRDRPAAGWCECCERRRPGVSEGVCPACRREHDRRIEAARRAR